MLHWEIARRDLFHSTRSLLHSPGFTATAVLLVTIGIGANVAVFTLANFVLVRPLPFPEPNRLVKVSEKHPGYARMELSSTVSSGLDGHHRRVQGKMDSMVKSLEEALISVWQQVFAEDARTVILNGASYPIRRTSRSKLREVDFKFEDD